jgi:hypothetical protein
VTRGRWLSRFARPWRSATNPEGLFPASMSTAGNGIRARPIQTVSSAHAIRGRVDGLMKGALERT